MSTDQNYVGGGDSATSTEQTAENATQTAQNEGQPSRFKTQEEFDEWYNTFVDEYFMEVSRKRGPAEYIRHILDDLFEFYGTNDPTPAILELTEERLDNFREGLSQERVIQVKQILSTCKLLIELRGYMECLHNETSDFESEGPKL